MAAGQAPPIGRRASARRKNSCVALRADGRAVGLIQWSDAPRARDPIVFGTGQDERERVRTLEPRAWDPLYSQWADVLEAHEGELETVWISDGLTHDGTARDRLIETLRAKGPAQHRRRRQGHECSRRTANREFSTDRHRAPRQRCRAGRPTFGGGRSGPERPQSGSRAGAGP